MADHINHPPHYASGTVECIDAIEAASSPEEFQGYLRGNIFKYLWRMQHKHDSPIDDLLKTKWYLDRLISSLQK